MDLRKLDLILSVVLLINSVRIFYLIVTNDDPVPFDYMVLFFSTVGAVILFMNSRRRKMKEEGRLEE
ncbi:hypothetical protein KP77_32680 [Jeotgalibacillus alimentarius]|uniref:Uncharacterized protein n=1 Tax=Jeotgalibacillus alimentarius TaxID=135826 RepID=A0A0C2V3F7_9BACL|nr:hypothetical protein [Jeotgalibacillus alimentarius]KIL43562.1 hypothetical protein KP77_32680 [Jeotgalibacillus alimentarius]